MLDLTNVEEVSFDLLPTGEYPVRVVEAEIKDTKAGTGQYINVQLEVIGDSYTGRKLFHAFNIKNPNAKAVQIGLGQLKSMLTKANSKKLKLDSPNDLLNLEFVAVVKIQKGRDGYDDQNQVSAFKEMTRTVNTFTSNDSIPF